MKVILLKDLEGKGVKGDLIEVAPGYAHNFLFRNGIAQMADSQNLSEFKNREMARERREKIEREENTTIASKLNGKTIKLTAKAGQGKLFGAITNNEVAEALKKEFDVDVDRKKIEMEDIKSFGTFDAEIRLMAGVSASIFVNVTEE